MDSLFHFVFPLIACLAARIHAKHGIEMVLGLAFASVLLDLDHVVGVPRGTLHSLFIVVVLPLILLAIAIRYEKKGTYWKTFCLGLLLVLSSHIVLDMFTEGGVQLLYPVSSTVYTMPFNISIGLPHGNSYLVTGAGIGLSIYFAMIMLIIFAEDFFAFLNGGKSAKKSLRKTIRMEERRIKEEL